MPRLTLTQTHNKLEIVYDLLRDDQIGYYDAFNVIEAVHNNACLTANLGPIPSPEFLEQMQGSNKAKVTNNEEDEENEGYEESMEESEEE